MDGGEQSPPSFFWGDILHFRIQLAEMENVPCCFTGGRRREYAGRCGSRLEQGGGPSSNTKEREGS